MVFILRLSIVIPLVTIPTAISLWTGLSKAYKPELAESGVLFWSYGACAYAGVIILGTLLSRIPTISRTWMESLTLACVFLEVLATCIVAYLVGAPAGTYSCFVLVFVVFYRLYYNHQFGLITTGMIIAGWFIQTGLESGGLPPSPLMQEPSV